MTKSEAIQIVLTEYESWVLDTIDADRYFYEYAHDENPELHKALQLIDGLPSGTSVDVTVTAT